MLTQLAHHIRAGPLPSRPPPSEQRHQGLQVYCTASLPRRWLQSWGLGLKASSARSNTQQVRIGRQQAEEGRAHSAQQVDAEPGHPAGREVVSSSRLHPPGRREKSAVTSLCYSPGEARHLEECLPGLPPDRDTILVSGSEQGIVHRKLSSLTRNATCREVYTSLPCVCFAHHVANPVCMQGCITKPRTSAQLSTLFCLGMQPCCAMPCMCACKTLDV